MTTPKQTESRTTHTPGPLSVLGQPDPDSSAWAIGTPELRGMGGRDYRMGFAEQHTALVYSHADAVLYAAAPDLAQACKDALVTFRAIAIIQGTPEPTRMICDALRAALLKAGLA